MIDGGDAEKTGTVMNRGTWISSWSGSCDVCCGNGFSGSDVNLSDCCCCGDGYGYGSVQNPNGHGKQNSLVEGWLFSEGQKTG